MPRPSTVEIGRLRERLRTRDQELRRAIHAALIGSDDKTYAEVAGRVLDSAELAVADIMADDRILEMEKEVAEQAEVVAALARITDGTYGTCQDCEDDIGLQRLEANPSARRCIRCQTHFESTHRGGRDSTPSL